MDVCLRSSERKLMNYVFDYYPYRHPLLHLWGNAVREGHSNHCSINSAGCGFFVSLRRKTNIQPWRRRVDGRCLVIKYGIDHNHNVILRWCDNVHPRSRLFIPEPRPNDNIGTRERVVCKSSSPDTQRCLIYTLDESNQQRRRLEYSARTNSCSRSEIQIHHSPLQSKATTCAQRVQWIHFETNIWNSNTNRRRCNTKYNNPRVERIALESTLLLHCDMTKWMPPRTKEMLLCTEEPAKDEQAHSCSSRLQLGKTYKHERMHCAREGVDDAGPPPSEDT